MLRDERPKCLKHFLLLKKTKKPYKTKDNATTTKF